MIVPINESKLAALRIFTLIVVTGAVATFLFVAPAAGQDGLLPRNALWEVVHNVCVPDQSKQLNPRPCLKVDLTGGIEKGFAILKDPRGVAQFLLIPTIQISGIESPVLLGPAATNYYADAWKARTFIDSALGKSLERDGIGLAVNSVASRSQDQLHIHIACVNSTVLEILHKYQGRIGSQWSPFNPSLLGRYYSAIWISGEDLGPNNPFNILAESLPETKRDMGDRTLVVIGLNRADGTKGFDILTDRVSNQSGDLAHGEGLLDHSCKIATIEK